MKSAINPSSSCNFRVAPRMLGMHPHYHPPPSRAKAAAGDAATSLRGGLSNDPPPAPPSAARQVGDLSPLPCRRCRRRPASPSPPLLSGTTMPLLSLSTSIAGERWEVCVGTDERPSQASHGGNCEVGGGFGSRGKMGIINPLGPSRGRAHAGGGRGRIGEKGGNRDVEEVAGGCGESRKRSARGWWRGGWRA